MMSRYDQLVAMGFKPTRRTLARLRKGWDAIDDTVAPEGEADGSFSSFVQWVNKATSWIGGTGAKCYDTQGRRCRIGADMQRANDEGAFPVRWYLPERFPPPPVFGVRRVGAGWAVTKDGTILASLTRSLDGWTTTLPSDPKGERSFARPVNARDFARDQWWPWALRVNGPGTRAALAVASDIN